MHSKWHKQLSQIPTIKSAGLLDVTPFDQGLSNQSLLVETRKGQWVVRLNRPQVGVNRSLEAEILQLIEPLKITPTIIENNPKAGYLITEYLAKPTWTRANFADANQLESLQSQLKHLHSIRFKHVSSRLDQRLKLYLQTFTAIPSDISQSITEQITHLNELDFWPACNHLCHYDLNPNNIMGDQPMIIDWEFAGQGHPLIDWLIIEHETGHDLRACYPNGINPGWISPARNLIKGLMTLWQLNQ
jgi:aminoglycoside phosphotransferase (APT) family kinase protein